METKFWTFKLSLLLVIALAMALSAAAADLPADAAAAVAAYDKAVAEIQAKADAQKVEMVKRLMPVLDAAMKKATQAGNLDAAMAVKAKREEMVGAFSAVALGLVTVDPKVQAIAGQWKRGAYLVTLNIDGTFLDSRNVGGKWTANKDGSFSMLWNDSGVTTTCAKPVHGVSQELGGFVLSKVP